jgi:hypothetical protein
LYPGLTASRFIFNRAPEGADSTFEKVPFGLRPASYVDAYFITGFNLSVSDSSTTAEKRAWMKALLQTASKDYQGVQTRKYDDVASDSFSLVRMEQACGLVVREFLKYLDELQVWDEEDWIKTAIGHAASIIL